MSDQPAPEIRGCGAVLFDLSKLMGVVLVIIVLGWVLMRLLQYVI